MPRSILTPRVGSMLWYYANAGAATAQAAIVVNIPDNTHFDLFILSAAGVGSAALGVLFCDRSFQPTTAYCEAIVADARLTGGTGPSQTLMEVASVMQTGKTMEGKTPREPEPEPEPPHKRGRHAA